jgi:PIN domain nuclease of toxin-antitoxin system
MGNAEVMVLLDTHVAVWLVLEPNKLSREAIAAIARGRKTGSGIAISIVSEFEIAWLIVKGRIQTILSVEQFLQDLESHFIVLPLNTEVAARAAQLPLSYPRDPMDRIIGATAIVEGLALVTADDAIHNSKALQTVW